MMMFVSIMCLFLMASPILIAGYSFNGREGWKDVTCDSMDDCHNTGTMIGNYICTNMGNCFCGSAYNCSCKGNFGDCHCQRATNCYAAPSTGDVFGECVDGAVYCENGIGTCNCGTSPSCICRSSWLGDIKYDSAITDAVVEFSCSTLSTNNGGSVCLNGGDIAGIVIGSLAFFALVVYGIYRCRKNRLSNIVTSPSVNVTNYPNTNGEIQVINHASMGYAQPGINQVSFDPSPQTNFYPSAYPTSHENPPMVYPIQMGVPQAPIMVSSSVYPQPDSNPYNQYQQVNQMNQMNQMQMGTGPYPGSAPMGVYPQQQSTVYNQQPNANPYSQVYPQTGNSSFNY